ncbi:D-alanyl-D-alanine carboxypeptidase family protein [Frigidibacter sp. ROC022]|uniref:D-alanyl-D-alanine carboxypeptidase family protein n=1 Tax=Frigidibacter sp. ROC022 TaxID=2971796 RepID=UPI00215B76BE|nr:D-alanyl-D-alanine carboxypeptidase family protein [Frigidibacter sp. ROC022]MCR8723093.1 D-alanyl-D-alanine carboxypeptidase [Frigidibacter sp. ROC022]
MTRLLIRLFLFVTLLLPALPDSALAFETRARAAYVLDLSTGTVLLEKNADEALPPASMSKLMTVNMLFEALHDGRVTLDTRFGVSSRAKAMQGSTMFLNEQDRPTVEELIQGIVVLSGNDACVAVAEGLAGTEEAFAQQMNERAPKIGLTNSHFVNASGWPAPGHRMSMRDLGTLAAHIITEFPEYYGYFSEKEFLWDGRAPDNRFNRNPLLKLGIGADGLKTGHTSEAGYGLVGSAVQGDRRIVVVITGLRSEKERAEEAEALVNWAFRQFVQKTVAPKGKVLAEAAVWLGDSPTVGLVPAEDVNLLIPAVHRDGVPGVVQYSGPIEAPIAEGQQLGTLVVALDGMPEHRVPLVADHAVAKGGIWPRLTTAAKVLYGRYVAPEEAPAPTPAAAAPADSGAAPADKE